MEEETPISHARARNAGLTIMVGGPEQVFQRILPLFELMGGFAGSRILELHGERMIKRTFDPGLRIKLHQEDLNLALSGARSLGLSLPGAALAQELINACKGNGWDDLDHSALVRALESMADHEVA